MRDRGIGVPLTYDGSSDPGQGGRAMSAAPFVSVQGIEKRFGGVQALRGVNLTVLPGEIHILAGANGAGKSTLAKIIAGIVPPDQGKVLIRGQEVRLHSRLDAARMGIAIVLQESSLIPDLTIAENIFLHELARGVRLDLRALRARAQHLLEDLEVADTLAPDVPVRNLSVAYQQLVEIAKALALDAQVLILDEPTAALSPKEVRVLVGIVKKLLRAGKSIIYVTHRLEEIYALGQRITVLRDGACVVEGEEIGNVPLHRLVQLMAGSEQPEAYVPTPYANGDAPARRARLAVLRHPSVELGGRPFCLYEGQITGLAGLVGSGRTRFARSLFGLGAKGTLHLELDGERVDIRSPKEAVRHGIAFVPEDRRRQGLIKDLSTLENALICSLARSRAIKLRYGEMMDGLVRLLERFRMTPDVLHRPVFTLSGGMQQKIVLIKWLLTQPRVLILDEPTAGVDVLTRMEIYEVLRQLQESGVAILLISSEFEELLKICERIVVISDGNIVGDLRSEGLDKETLLMYALPRRSSMALRRVLEELHKVVGGPAFWITINSDTVFCMEATGNTKLLGFEGGRSTKITSCAIRDALEGIRRGLSSPAEIVESNGAWRTLLFPLRTRNGHDLGVVGVSHPLADSLGPSVTEVALRVSSPMEQAVEMVEGLHQFEAEVRRDA